MSEIRLKNALSQMKNEAVSERKNHIRKHRNQQGEAWSVECQLADPQDARRMNGFMQHELDLYNQILEYFNPTARTAPEIFSAFTEEHINLFAFLAQHGIDIRRIRKSNLPDVMKEFETILFDGSISERMKILMESVGGSYSMLESTKKAMARELMKFYAEDARVRQQRMPKGGDQEFKTPPKSLAQQTPISKRHLQMKRDQVKIKFNEKEDRSEISIPYCSSPIYVKEVDLSDRNSWNIMIVHQTPNVMVLPGSPWVLDFRGIKNDYLVDYLDNRNDKSGVFWHAKSNRSGR